MNRDWRCTMVERGREQYHFVALEKDDPIRERWSMIHDTPGLIEPGTVGTLRRDPVDGQAYFVPD